MIESHIQQKTIEELAYYPEHADREASVEYRRNHHYLVHVCDIGCAVCGSKENRETHHWFEWATWNEVDATYAQSIFDGSVWYQFDPYGFGTMLKGNTVKDPDDIRNLLVLCRKHHREVEVGFHETTGPLWFANDGGVKPDEILNQSYDG